MDKAERKLNKCRKGKDFIKLADRLGAEIEPGRGSHIKARYGDTLMVIPDHGGKDLGKGLRSKITKWFYSAGLIALVLAVLLAVL